MYERSTCHTDLNNLLDENIIIKILSTKLYIESLKLYKNERYELCV